jgi:shikimate kinase
MKNVILIGFMGTGKTSVSRALAGRLGWNRIDTDAEIEKREARSIAQLFEAVGEAGFRQIETEVISDVLRSDRQVVATGGGAVLREENRALMLNRGFVVALTASKDAIIERVRGDRGRPLLQGNLEDRVNRLLEERKHAYDFAHLKLDTTHLSVDQVVERILQEMNFNGRIEKEQKKGR